MNDTLIINGANSLIYAICIYDMEKEKVELFQVSYNYLFHFIYNRKLQISIIHGPKNKLIIIFLHLNLSKRKQDLLYIIRIWMHIARKK